MRPQQEPVTSGASGAPPIAGRSQIGVAAVEMDDIIIGWSTKKVILGKRVMNDAKERIGEQRVAISFQQLKMQGTNFVLAGATKDAVKALPEFKYARK